MLGTIRLNFCMWRGQFSVWHFKFSTYAYSLIRVSWNSIKMNYSAYWPSYPTFIVIIYWIKHSFDMEITGLMTIQRTTYFFLSLHYYLMRQIFFQTVKKTHITLYLDAKICIYFCMICWPYIIQRLFIFSHVFHCTFFLLNQKKKLRNLFLI